jgi:hypothetical protein
MYAEIIRTARNAGANTSLTISVLPNKGRKSRLDMPILSRDGGLNKTAVRWLRRSTDPRVRRNTDFKFDEILALRRRGIVIGIGRFDGVGPCLC